MGVGGWAVVLAAVALSGRAQGNDAAAQCCAGDCAVQDVSVEDGPRFDLSQACPLSGSDTPALRGEDAEGTTFEVNICPNCTTLCAPVGEPSAFGAVVQSVGQAPASGGPMCKHPYTKEPINCTRPCAVVATWPLAQVFTVTDAGSSAPVGFVIDFAPTPASPSGTFALECDSARLVQSWLPKQPVLPDPARPPPHAGTPGFRVSVTTLCDILAEEPFVSNVSKPNASDPCSIAIEVRSVAGCAELELDVAWFMFMVAAFATVAVVLVSSALRLGLTGECGFMEPPKTVSTVLSVVWAAMAADEELDFLRLTASAADPDSWIAIDSSQQEQEAAAFAASVAMAAALGLTQPPIPYGPAEVRAMLEAKAGRALSPTEVKWMKEEYARVGVGLPMPWGGIVTEGRFRRAYTRELIQQHGRSDGGGEETDDDDDTAETAAADAKREALKLGASGEQAEAAAERARAKWYRRMAARDNARRRTAQAAEEEAASLWRNALDPMGRGFITAIELLSVPSRAIAAELKMGVQFDPSNTEEWELYLQDGSAVTTLLRQHWASHAALTQSMAQMAQGSLAALRASDSSEAAIERVVQAAVAGGCGMLYIEQWRQGYLESLEGSDFVADLVSAEVVKVAAEAGVCRSGMASPPPLTRPKNLRENGDPSLPVYVMVAISEETLAVVLDRVAAMFSRELSRDPALQDIAKMSFAS